MSSLTLHARWMFRHTLGWVGWGGVGWGVMSSLTLHARWMFRDTLGWGGWGGVKFLHIERKITSVVHSHPPSHYIRKHAPG